MHACFLFYSNLYQLPTVKMRGSNYKVLQSRGQEKSISYSYFLPQEAREGAIIMIIMIKGRPRENDGEQRIGNHMGLSSAFLRAN